MPKILIVDDDEVQRGIYEAVFTDAKFEVVTALDGAQGFEKFQAEKPDVLFTGIMMPGLSGFELTEKVRQESPSLPVIMFSHLGKQEDRDRAREQNVSFMVKGLNSPKDILQQALDDLKPKSGNEHSHHSDVIKNIKFND